MYIKIVIFQIKLYRVLVKIVYLRNVHFRYLNVISVSY